MSKTAKHAPKPAAPKPTSKRSPKAKDPHPMMTAFADAVLPETPATEGDSPVEDFACNEEAETASSPSSNLNPAVATTEPVNPPETPAQEKKMEIVLKRSDAPRKTNRLVIYNLEGRNGSVQFLSTLFGGSQKDRGNPPETLTLVGDFAEPKQPKVKLTKEERKALRANAPKPTLADKLAKAQARMDALKAKLAAEAAAAEAPAAQ
jgi:hypothetical protein